jgi:hypothetical protein
MTIDSGRAVAYLGGSAVSVSGVAGKASATTEPVAEAAEKSISLLQFPIAISDVTVTVGDMTTLVGAGVVVVRLVWDIYRERKNRRVAGEK